MAERRRRLATGEDGDLWRRAMRDVAPLGERRPPPPEPPPAAAAPSASRPDPMPLPPIAPDLPPLDRFAGIDRASAERLKRGRVAIEARLDLHGMTQAEAHHALAGFVAGGRTAGRRCVLVITGRGVAGGGVLRHAVPRWLDEPGLRRHLLAIAPAQPRDGGNGALYLLLRRMPAEASLDR
ncbi:MAG TPA: Smr/MutS family protein [Stellaceae bacterium]|jgi:DNA-nicking Smr family endonuclease|nr:Smr/MutS family protein [Stellaceae bacterium]